MEFFLPVIHLLKAKSSFERKGRERHPNCDPPPLVAFADDSLGFSTAKGVAVLAKRRLCAAKAYLQIRLELSQEGFLLFHVL